MSLIHGSRSRKDDIQSICSGIIEAGFGSVASRGCFAAVFVGAEGVAMHERFLEEAGGRSRSLEISGSGRGGGIRNTDATKVHREYKYVQPCALGYSSPLHDDYRLVAPCLVGTDFKINLGYT